MVDQPPEEIIELTFDLPFCLKIEAETPLVYEDYVGTVRIETIARDKPAVPGVGSMENARLIHDDTNYIAHSRVTSIVWFCVPADNRRLFLFNEVPRVALGIANLLVNSARFFLEDYVLKDLLTSAQLGPIRTRHLTQEGATISEGSYTAFQSGIGPTGPSTYTALQAARFFAAIAHGHVPAPYQLLYLDAETFRIKGDHRMAIANLALSFEAFLFYVVHELCDPIPNLEDWSINKLGVAGFRRAFGHALESSDYWGNEAVANFRLLKRMRDRVLHKLNMEIEWGDEVIDLSTVSGIDRVFSSFVSLGQLISQRLHERQALTKV